MKPGADTSPLPGDFVIVRGGQACSIWAKTTVDSKPAMGGRVGTVMPGALGIVVVPAATVNGWHTMVLWSVPCITGWIADGYLRRVT